MNKLTHTHTHIFTSTNTQQHMHPELEEDQVSACPGSCSFTVSLQRLSLHACCQCFPHTLHCSYLFTFYRNTREVRRHDAHCTVHRCLFVAEWVQPRYLMGVLHSGCTQKREFEAFCHTNTPVCACFGICIRLWVCSFTGSGLDFNLGLARSTHPYNREIATDAWKK